MLPPTAFGHYFTFAATANFATSLFSSAQTMLNKIIANFDFEDLLKQKSNFEDKYYNVKEIVALKERIADDNTKKKIREWNINGNKLMMKADKYQKRMNYYLDGDKNKLSEQFIEAYKKTTQPFFSLSGTYCVIILLLMAFAETYPSYEIVTKNIFGFTVLFMCILIFINIKGLKKVNAIYWRNCIVNGILISVSFLALIPGFIAASNTKNILIHINGTIGFIVFILSLILAGTPLIIVVFKNTRLIIAIYKHKKTLTESNVYLDKHINEMQNF